MLNSLTEPRYADSYLRIVDFSDPGDPSKGSIDIMTDKITTPIRLPLNVPSLSGGVLWISDGVMHMLPGTYLSNSNYTTDEFGNIIPITNRPYLTNKVWNFDLKSQKWDVGGSGVEENTVNPAIAFDAKTQVAWYYGGRSRLSNQHDDTIGLHDLYRLDRGKETPIKVATDSSIVGTVVYGDLIHIEGAGEAGILVLLGGDANGSSNLYQPVSIMNQIGRPPQVAFWLIYSLLLQRSFVIVHVWDIATKTWFAQSTTVETGSLYPGSDTIQQCAVIASAEDNSSHNIYVYIGGPDTALLGVFILTLPAFHWVLVDQPPEDDHWRVILTNCLKVHEKHMVLYRGGVYVADNLTCDYEKSSKRFQGMAIYDMSSLTWTTKVELKNQKYLVPEILYAVIGGK